MYSPDSCPLGGHAIYRRYLGLTVTGMLIYTWTDSHVSPRQSRFVFHQPLTWFVCKRVVIIYYPLLANATHVQQIYGAAVIKSGTSSYVVVVEVSGLKWSRCWCETINLLYNYTIIFFLPHSRVLPHYVQLLCHSPIEGLNRKRELTVFDNPSELVQNFTLVLARVYDTVIYSWC